jgi:hypothetical protein
LDAEPGLAGHKPHHSRVMRFFRQFETWISWVFAIAATQPTVPSGATLKLLEGPEQRGLKVSVVFPPPASTEVRPG